MRLQSYLIESKTDILVNDPIEKAKIIKDECGQFINMSKKVSKPMPNKMVYRAIDGFNSQFAKIQPRTDRRPLDTLQVVHDMIDNMFKTYFGYKYRSKGVMTSIKPRRSYGILYYFFPTDGYKYIYNENIRDLFHTLDSRFSNLLKTFLSNIPYFIKENGEEKVLEIIHQIVSNYKENKNWSSVYDKNLEIMWRCKSYYILNVDMMSIQDGIKFFEELEN